MRTGFAILCLFLLFANQIVTAYADDRPVIRIGSKNFTESFILGEILAQLIEATGEARVERRFGLGGTGICYQALQHDEIDVYPEYTGTLKTAILHKSEAMTLEELRSELAKVGLAFSNFIGFNNSYGLAMPRATAERLNIERISDLREHPQLRMAFSYEFMERKDGFAGLIAHYELSPQNYLRMDHALVYTALEEGKADVAEVFTTDSKIEKLNLIVLEDDLAFFPKYEGVLLYRKELLEKFPQWPEVMQKLEGVIDNNEMIRLNGLVEISNYSFAESARQFLTQEDVEAKGGRFWAPIKRQTPRHILLVFLPVFLAILVGLPLGIAAARIPAIGQMILISSGLIQTIPSLALLCFLIPVFGIGLFPSLIALFLYSLLPIVRSSHSGLISIEPHYIEVARVLGLNSWQRLWRIELPLATVQILSGVKTAAVIAVGLATLAAFIGAGGYGAMIVTGLALNNNRIILQGALPAALMAVVVHFLFEFVDYLLTPKGLRDR